MDIYIEILFFILVAISSSMAMFILIHLAFFIQKSRQESKLIKSDETKRNLIAKNFKEYIEKCELLDMINRIIMSSLHGQDYIEEITDYEPDFVFLLGKHTFPSPEAMAKLFYINYMTKLIVKHGYSLQRGDNDSVSLYRLGSYGLIKDEIMFIDSAFQEIRELKFVP